MKALNKAHAAPPLLAKFSQDSPNATWEKFSKKNRYTETKKQIRQDQRGLCAYCEIDLLNAQSTTEVSDFRIDHFHPKSPHHPPPNWAIDWRNLLGTCHGGSQRNVVNSNNRFTAPDISCDAIKADNDWTTQILNPLTDIPKHPRLFEYSTTTGEMSVDVQTCPPELIEKANNSITMLRLSSPRLNRLRMAIIESLQDQLIDMQATGAEFEEALKLLSNALFVDDEIKDFPSFFTLIRWYLDRAAEDRLQEINYT